ncbi:MAG: transcriptional repressor [Sedimentisphaerales bacterium]|nr:transcriptional repressor [Sedimentisphaerales bacterium]
MAQIDNDKMVMFEERCRKAGLKVTHQRKAIYQTLIESKLHPSADQVYRQIKRSISTISLDTVNRTLQKFNELGLAFTVEGSGEARRYDGNMHDHQHFKCIKCRRIIDFHHGEFDDIDIPPAIAKIYKILRKTVYFEGICDKCK